MPYYAGATDRVRFVGEPVAVVVAADRYLAEDAAELIDVDYEELPAVTRTQAALADGAPRLHEDAESNVATDRTFSFGPVDEAFAAADHVVSGDYSFPRYSSMPMECYCVVANWAETAEGPAVEAWANFHGPFSMVPVLAGRWACRRSGSGCTYPPISAAASASRRALPLRDADGAGQQARAAPGAVDRGPAGAPDRVLGGRRPADAVRGAVGADGTVTALRADLVRQRGRLPAPARAVHAVPLLRQHHRRLPHPRGAHPGPRRGHQQDADRAEPGFRRPAAVLRPGAADGQGGPGHRPGPGRGAAPELRHRVPLPDAERRGV